MQLLCYYVQWCLSSENTEDGNEITINATLVGKHCGAPHGAFVLVLYNIMLTDLSCQTVHYELSQQPHFTSLLCQRYSEQSIHILWMFATHFSAFFVCYDVHVYGFYKKNILLRTMMTEKLQQNSALHTPYVSYPALSEDRFFSMLLASIWLLNNKPLVFSITCWLTEGAWTPMTTWPYSNAKHKDMLIRVP